MNGAEPSFISTILSFLFNLLLFLLVTVLSFFGITLGDSSSSDADSPFAIPTIAVPAQVTAAAGTVTAGEIAQASGGLVNASWLATQLSDPNLRIVALVSADEFSNAHIPGAAQVDWPAFAITDTSAASISEWEASVSTEIGSLGVDQDSKVVVYDNGTHYAPRLWWILKALGHEDVSLLDGGLNAWLQSGQSVDSGAAPAATPAAASFTATPDSALIATKADVQAALDLPDTVLVDARTPEEYAAGHIPGAVNIPFSENYTADGALLGPDALTALYTDAGVTPDASIIVYCSTGVRAASDVFALNYLAYPDVRLYLGSYDEWSADPSLPVER
jgi:thiosulfate/3-mercaptopyruvate sulfurtransferase